MDPARSALFDAERVRELYGRTRGLRLYAASLISFLAASQAVAVIWAVVIPLRAVAWVAAMLLVQGGIALLIRAFHSRPRTADELPAWGRRRAAAELVHGLGWALAIPLVYVPGEMITLAAVIGMVSGMIGGVTASLSVHMPSMASFLAASITGSIVAFLLMWTGPVETYAILMMIACGVLCLANTARASSVYQEAIGLRLDLAAQVEERRQLQETAEDGRRLAEAAEAERTRFFGAASHDLRQPVHALGLYASLLRRDPPAQERRELIANIAACVDSLDRLFTAILGVARAARGRQEDSIVPFPLQDVIERVLLQLGPEAERRGLRLRVRPTRRWVHGDPSVVERILTNLASNAVRYTERGGVLIGVRSRGRRLELVVADTGVGLAETDRRRIFDAFYQVGLPHRDRTQGYGLGLATVRQLCLGHGYEIRVRSELGRGTVFRITLPQTAPLADPGAAPAAGADATMPQRLNVLLVEDDPLVADAVTRLLTAWEVGVHVCASADQAMAVLDSVKGGRWHAILDHRLPGLETGLQLAERIRQREGTPVTVSLLTGEADPELFAEAERRGIVVLQKPLKPIRLRALLANGALAEAG